MVFMVSRTFDDPASSQAGFPSPGDGAQTTGDGSPLPTNSIWEALRPIKGMLSWLYPSGPVEAARGFPAPENGGQRRPDGSMPNEAPIFGGVYMHETPYYDRGAAAFVPNFGKVLTNPIGAGVVALQRPQASYGPAAQYANGAIWWTSQVIPTSINLQGLTSPEEIAGLLNSLTVQAVVRTTG